MYRSVGLTHGLAKLWLVFPWINATKINSGLNLGDILYICRVIVHFVPNFIAMAMGVSRRKMRFAAFNNPSLKTQYRRKNLADISYTRRVIANFVPNFIAMATGVDRGKMRFAAFNGPCSKTPFETQKSHRCLLHRPSYSPFCPKFRCHGNQRVWGKIKWHH